MSKPKAGSGSSQDRGAVVRTPAVEPSLPAVHARHLLELVDRTPGDRGSVLEGLGIDEAQLADPSAHVSLRTFHELVDRARRATGEPGLGFYLGLQMRITAHGFLGFAAMSSKTVRDAVEVAMRFIPTRTSVLSLRLEVDDDIASLVIDEHADLEPSRDVIILAVLVGVSRIGAELRGRPASAGMDLAFPEPEYFHRFAHLVPGRVRFSQPASRLVFDASILELPLTFADPASFRLALEQCERELESLGTSTNIASRVRTLLTRKDGGFHSIGDVSAQMRLSERTLKRRLADQGTTFSELLDEIRREKAMLLLPSGLSIKEIAARLGYGEPAAFTRAFRRWTGASPSEFRRDSRADDGDDADVPDA